ncbi:NTP transferase domain-containing protein [Mumia sp. ZJ1417]|uniref:molybdenum cofactor guanylyltransferase n=1 Tax=Mumia sp. ZJ1417 TaxID=2708082 RepID=UPI00142094E5|nr:NTP transferase domain-containing protein [Mumia sp. ZJ1417]QMW66538.1 NTP transferase domain-containing protein [Mumia sp. ZJ1417]
MPVSPIVQPGVPPYDVIVVAGGSSRRFGSDKLAARVGGESLLDRVLGAASGGRHVRVVGPRRPTVRPVAWTREEPAGAGPAAAVVAGIAAIEGDSADAAPYVVLLAADLPYVTQETVDRLVTAVDESPTSDGALLVDPDGRAQYLCSAWRRDALTTAATRLADWDGVAVRALLEPLHVRQLPTRGREGHDVDRPEDLPSDA